jgi:hypothetical protein
MPADQPSMATALAAKKQTVKSRCLHVPVLIFGASMRILSIVLLPRLNLPQFHSRYRFRMNPQ